MRPKTQSVTKVLSFFAHKFVKRRHERPGRIMWRTNQRSQMAKANRPVTSHQNTGLEVTASFITSPCFVEAEIKQRGSWKRFADGGMRNNSRYLADRLIHRLQTSRMPQQKEEVEGRTERQHTTTH